LPKTVKESKNYIL